MTQYGTSRDFSETGRQSARKEASSSSTTTTTTDNGAGRAREWEILAETYCELIGPFDGMAQRIIRRFSQVMELDVIQHAIEETGWAPRPSKQYLSAILRRYAAEGITNMEDVYRDEDRHEQRRNSDLRIRDSRWYDDGSRLTEYDWEREAMRGI